MCALPATGMIPAMNYPIATSRFMLVPEVREASRDTAKPKVRRYRLTRLGDAGNAAERQRRFAHLQRMHD